MGNACSSGARPRNMARRGSLSGSQRARAAHSRVGAATGAFPSRRWIPAPGRDAGRRASTYFTPRCSRTASKTAWKPGRFLAGLLGLFLVPGVLGWCAGVCAAAGRACCPGSLASAWSAREGQARYTGTGATGLRSAKGIPAGAAARQSPSALPSPPPSRREKTPGKSVGPSGGILRRPGPSRPRLRPDPPPARAQQAPPAPPSFTGAKDRSAEGQAPVPFHILKYAIVSKEMPRSSAALPTPTLFVEEQFRGTFHFLMAL